MAAAFAFAFQQTVRVCHLGAMTKFHGYMLFINKNAAKWFGGSKQNAAIFHFFARHVCQLPYFRAHTIGDFIQGRITLLPIIQQIFHFLIHGLLLIWACRSDIGVRQSILNRYL